MIGILICGPTVRISDHELRYLARAAEILIISQAPPTPDSKEVMEAFSTSFLSNLKIPHEEAPPEPYINGSLRYLYRSPVKAINPVVRRLYTIRQPCWRAGRWKSLT